LKRPRLLLATKAQLRRGDSGMANRDNEDFLTTMLKELRENNAAVFVGAGLSKAAGYVDWPGLLSPIAKALGLDITKEADLVAVAQYHLNANASNRHNLNQLLIEEFSDLKAYREPHAARAAANPNILDD
jgi:hypothetical protein